MLPLKASSNHLFISIVLIATMFVYSCSSTKEEEEKSEGIKKELVFKGYHYALDTILKKKEGIIHGVELGNKLNDVKAKEPKKPDEMDVEYCLYNYKIDSTSAYSVAYSFIGDSLDEIEVQINTMSLDKGAEILNSLKKYYTTKYTAPLMDKGVYVFNCFDSKKRNFTISISDNSTTETGVITVFIYREK